MNETPPNPQTLMTKNAAPRSHLIDLSYDPAGNLCAIPQHPADPAGSTAGPITLPFIPISTTSWLITLSDMFRNRTDRCLAVLLLFDTTARSWGIGIPRQHSAMDSVCWSLGGDAGNPIPPDALLAGTWQMRAGVEHDELIGVVPRLPGIHFVVRPSDDESSLELHAFLRMGDEIRTISPGDVTFNDWEAALDDAQHRIIEV